MIKFLDIHKRFGDGTVALSDVSFRIGPGEFVVVTGPSGSGKTTLMKLLINDLIPTKGSVLFEGKDLSDLDKTSIPLHRRKIGVVFQDYRLLSELNVWENIALPLLISSKSESEIESRVTDLLNLVSLEEKALMFPKQLSGGEAQRVGVARALATGPGIIFADEPTGNLDKDSSLSIVRLLKQINDLGTTIILSTHDVTLLDFLKDLRRIELNRGELISDEGGIRPKEEVVEKEPVEVDKKEETEEKVDSADSTSPKKKSKKQKTKKVKKQKKDHKKIKLPSLKKKVKDKKKPSKEEVTKEDKEENTEEL